MIEVNTELPATVGSPAQFSALHSQTMGSGVDVVMVHGWGLHSGIFSDLAQALARTARVTVVDLPGHGRSPYTPGDLALPAICARLAVQFPMPAIWMGWSLGGLIALCMAQYQPAQVRALVLAATSPRFTSGEDWPHAMAPAVLNGFSNALADDYQATLLRFLALQTRGSADAAGNLRRLRTCLRAAPEPPLAALQAGLQLLMHEDRRRALLQLQLPVLAMAGERDTLVPLAAVRAWAGCMPQVELKVYPGAGHAPFISHADACLADLEGFVRALT